MGTTWCGTAEGKVQSLCPQKGAHTEGGREDKEHRPEQRRGMNTGRMLRGQCQARPFSDPTEQGRRGPACPHGHAALLTPVTPRSRYFQRDSASKVFSLG